MGTILSILTVIASFVTLLDVIYRIIKKKSLCKILIASVVFLFMFSTATLSVLYEKQVNKKLERIEKLETLEQEARVLLNRSPSYISHYEPGQSEGLCFNVLIMLERNSELHPQTYKLYQEMVISKIEEARKIENEYDRRKLMEEAGKSALQILKGLANKN